MDHSIPCISADKATNTFNLSTPSILRKPKNLIINGQKLRLLKNIPANGLAVVLCQASPDLTEQQIHKLGGELWEVSWLRLILVGVKSLFLEAVHDIS